MAERIRSDEDEQAHVLLRLFVDQLREDGVIWQAIKDAVRLQHWVDIEIKVSLTGTAKVRAPEVRITVRGAAP